MTAQKPACSYWRCTTNEGYAWAVAHASNDKTISLEVFNNSGRKLLFAKDIPTTSADRIETLLTQGGNGIVVFNATRCKLNGGEYHPRMWKGTDHPPFCELEE